MNVHERLQRMLEHYDWSVYKLSKECGLSESTIRNVLSGNHAPSVITMEAICNGFGITLSQFFAETEPVELTQEQNDLFNKWLLLTTEQKAAVYHVIDTFAQKN